MPVVLKIFPVLIQYLDWEKGELHSKLVDVESNPHETAQTVTYYVHGTLENKDLNKFSGDKCWEQ
jgi:redox-sensitive bicupin YhaK (pirin superfamily)